MVPIEQVGQDLLIFHEFPKESNGKLCSAEVAILADRYSDTNMKGTHVRIIPPNEQEVPRCKRINERLI